MSPAYKFMSFQYLHYKQMKEGVGCGANVSYMLRFIVPITFFMIADRIVNGSYHFLAFLLCPLSARAVAKF